MKTAYAVKGHSCDEDADDDAPGDSAGKPAEANPGAAKPAGGAAGQTGTQKPQ
jgi:hypothetical protein